MNADFGFNANYHYKDGIVVNASDYDSAEKKHKKIKKCKNCDGTGFVQIGTNIKGIKKCPLCNINRTLERKKYGEINKKG